MAQYARPDSDIDSGDWEDTTGGDSDGYLWDEIDEITADDNDYIRRGGLGGCEIGLSDITDPESSSDHIVRVRGRRSGMSGSITTKLMQGAEEIASDNTDPGVAFDTWTFTLAGNEADAITDYTDLRLVFISEGLYGADVSWAELEVPDAAPPPAAIPRYPAVIFQCPAIV